MTFDSPEEEESTDEELVKTPKYEPYENGDWIDSSNDLPPTPEHNPECEITTYKLAEKDVGWIAISEEKEDGELSMSEEIGADPMSPVRISTSTSSSSKKKDKSAKKKKSREKKQRKEEIEKMYVTLEGIPTSVLQSKLTVVTKLQYCCMSFKRFTEYCERQAKECRAKALYDRAVRVLTALESYPLTEFRDFLQLQTHRTDVKRPRKYIKKLDNDRQDHFRRDVDLLLKKSQILENIESSIRDSVSLTNVHIEYGRWYDRGIRVTARKEQLKKKYQDGTPSDRKPTKEKALSAGERVIFLDEHNKTQLRLRSKMARHILLTFPMLAEVSKSKFQDEYGPELCKSFTEFVSSERLWYVKIARRLEYGIECLELGLRVTGCAWIEKALFSDDKEDQEDFFCVFSDFFDERIVRCALEFVRTPKELLQTATDLKSQFEVFTNAKTTLPPIKEVVDTIDLTDDIDEIDDNKSQPGNKKILTIEQALSSSRQNIPDSERSGKSTALRPKRPRISIQFPK